MTRKMHLKHILLQHQYQAEDVLRLLKHGEEFSVIAHKHSQCSSKTAGGDLGLIALDRLEETFKEAAEVLKVGELSPIVRTRFGYHLILRLS